MDSGGRDRTAKIILAVVLLGIVLAFTYSSTEPRKRDSRLQSVCERIYYEYLNLGLDVPHNMQEYYSSVMGSPYRCLTGRIRYQSHTLNPAVIKNIQHKWHLDFVHENLVCTIRYEVCYRQFLLWPRHRSERLEIHKGLYPSPERTTVLLKSISSGTELWKRSVMRKSSYVGMTPVNIDSVPAISFDRPATEKELNEYWIWLLKMSGSLDRFRDDWGHRLRLTIDNGGSHTILAASSAGPDGIWDTSDDLTLKRHAKTGRVFSKMGF